MIGYFVLGFLLVWVIYFLLQDHNTYLDNWRFDDEDWD